MFRINIDLAILFVIAFIFTYILAKPYMRKARKQGLIAKDMYKPGQPYIPTAGGLVILAGTLLSLVLMFFMGFNMIPMLIFYFIILTFSFYGLADDLLGFKMRSHKVWILFFLALPIALMVTDTVLNIGGISWELGWFFAFIIAPIYVLVVPNLLNTHSGFNGLSSGLAVLMMFFAGLKSFFESGFTYLPLLIPVFAATLAYWFYNKYPAKMFEGNIGPFFYGGALGAFLIIANLEWFGFIMLIPHSINILLWFIWVLLKKFKPHKYPHIKFAKVREDSTIQAPNYLTVKYIVCKLFRVNEWRATLICYSITTVFAVIGLIFF